MLPSFVRRGGALAAVAFVAPPLFAQSSPRQLAPIVVTASRAPQSLLELVADVTYIDAAEIAQSGAQSLAALLARAPGIEFVQNGGPGATSGVFLRGANAAQTLVLIDGMRVASASSGATALEAIPLDQIDHIEILRGPATSLYGADAIGGVVQVFTRKGTTGLSANASIGYGSHETWIASAGVAGGSERARGAMTIAGRRSLGFNAIENPANFAYDPDRDGYRDASVSGQGSFDWAARQRISAQYFRSRLDSQFDGGDAFDDRTITTLTMWQVASANHVREGIDSRLYAGEGRDRSVSKTGSGDFPFVTRQRQYGWQGDFALPHGSLTTALERREERVDASPSFAVSARDTNAITGVYRLEAGANALQANLRHDDSSQFGGRTTGALAWGYRIAPAFRVTASAGTAFRAPTFNDLYYPGFSNPALRPETSRNVEAGVHWNAQAGEASWQASVVAFRNRVRDLIVFECNADFVCAPDNVADATLRGVEAYADAQIRDTHVHASLDMQAPTDDATGQLLPRRARRHGVFSITQALGSWRLTAETAASSERFDDAANTRRMAGYAIVNLVAEWMATPRTTFFLRADNVFDRQYELAADFATGGARVFGGMRWRL